MKVAVYTIALNEEHFVERWAESAKNADYRFIFDTGSTDNTLLKAAEVGVEVFQGFIRPWRFDDARNAALSLLPDDIDYCIALDMDEVLIEGWREELEKLITLDVTRPRYKYTWSWADPEETIPGLQYGGDKIHTRHGYRWKHPVHETLTTDRLQETQGWCDLEIHHHPDHSKSRGQYFPLLELAIQEDPYDDRNMYYYARELFYNDQLEKAAKHFKAHLALPKATWGPERAASCRYLAKCEPQSAETWLKQAMAEAPGRREAMVEYALHLEKQGNWVECREVSLQVLDIVEKPLDYLCEDFAWGAQPYDHVALSSYYLGNYAEALEYGLKAVEVEPNNGRLLDNLKWYKSALDLPA